MCKISLLILGSGHRGGFFTSDWSGLFTMKACKVKMITMLSAKCVFSQTGMRPNYCKKKGLRIVWCFSVLQFSEFESFFFCGVSARNKNSVLWRSHKQNAYFHYAFKIFW